MSDSVNIERQAAVFITIEVFVPNCTDPIKAAGLIGEDLESMQSKGIEITNIVIGRGVAGTPIVGDEEDEDDD